MTPHGLVVCYFDVSKVQMRRNRVLLGLKKTILVSVMGRSRNSLYFSITYKKSKIMHPHFGFYASYLSSFFQTWDKLALTFWSGGRWV